jgi:hypothetical protein
VAVLARGAACGSSSWASLPSDIRRYIFWQLCFIPSSAAWIGLQPQQAYECVLFLMHVARKRLAGELLQGIKEQMASCLTHSSS